MARKSKTRSRSKRNARTVTRRSAMVFSKTNYVMLGACLLAITVGYTMMRLENSVDGFVSLYVSPIILIIGYMGVIAAILYRPKKTDTSPQ